MPTIEQSPNKYKKYFSLCSPCGAAASKRKMASISLPASTSLPQPCLQQQVVAGCDRERSDDDFNATFERCIIPSVSIPLFGGDSAEDNIQDSLEWLQTVMKKNVPYGKQKRGRLIEFIYNQLVPEASAEQQNLARILGWCVEILQAGFLIADDIMDNGVTRRGQPCWYLQNNMGSAAFNDSLMLEHVTYQLLRKYFSHLPVYAELVDLTLRVSFQTTLGESLDTRRSKSREFGQFTESLYFSIVEFKTGYYTCFLPIALALLFAGYSRNEARYQRIWENVERLTLKMGTLFQVQDDFMDCYSSEQKLGKRGTDIEEGKCTWLFVKAKQLCTDNAQLLKLVNNYGHDEPEKVKQVKQLYNELNVPAEYQKFIKSESASIVSEIECFEDPVVGTVLNSVLQVIRDR